MMKTCKKCGAEIKSDDKYCPNCGEKTENNVHRKDKNNNVNRGTEIQSDKGPGLKFGKFQLGTKNSYHLELILCFAIPIFSIIIWWYFYGIEVIILPIAGIIISTYILYKQEDKMLQKPATILMIICVIILLVFFALLINDYVDMYFKYEDLLNSPLY